MAAEEEEDSSLAAVAEKQYSWREAARSVGAKSPKLAVALWRKICQESCAEDDWLGLGLALARLNKEEAVSILRKLLDREEAKIALSGLLLRQKKAEDCLALAGDSIELKYNKQTALRQLGRYEEAIRIAWDSDERPLIREKVILQPIKKLTIVCLKWGIKYGPEYVNRLYASLRRFSNDFDFFCYTDNSDGVIPPVRMLPPGAPRGWWAKAYLFSRDAGLNGSKVCFFDLDTIITGNIFEFLAEDTVYTRLGLLSTSEIRNESRRAGFNSSIMTWTPDASFCDAIFLKLSSRIHSQIYKFDHWLEMLFWPSSNITLLSSWPVSDYRPDRPASEYLPLPNSDRGRIIIFPLHPKPHHLLLLEGEIKKKKNYPNFILDHWLKLSP